MDETGLVVEAELVADIVLHNDGGGGGEGDYRGGAKGGEVAAEEAVIRAEIVTPLRDAMRFVNGDEGGFALGEHLREADDAEAFGGDEEELEFAVEVVYADLAGGRAVAPGVDAFDGETKVAQLGELVFHEGDERADDQGGAAAREAG